MNLDYYIKELVIRPKKVLEALIWLKQYHPDYKDIVISKDFMNEVENLPEG